MGRGEEEKMNEKAHPAGLRRMVAGGVAGKAAMMTQHTTVVAEQWMKGGLQISRLPDGLARKNFVICQGDIFHSFTPFTMNNLLTRFSAFCALILLLATLASRAQAPATPQKVKMKIKPLITTVYIVRHAEKDTLTKIDDPELSAEGRARAQALNQLLARRQPAALFTTETKRARATLAPLAAALKLEPQAYDPKRGRDLADRILKEYAGKSVVIVGHSNTVLSLIDDFGGIPPVDEIRDNEHDYLFVVRVAPGMQPTVETRGYGAERREPVASRLQKTKEKEMKIQAKAVK